MPTEFQNSIFHHRNMDSVKFCQIPLKVFKDSLDFYIDLVKFLQKLSDSILFSNGRFELQYNIYDATFPHFINEKRSNSYTDIEKIRLEIEMAKNIFKKYEWPIIDVTRKSVEETAASIIKFYDIVHSQ